MKKLLRLLAMLLCVFALIACGDDDNDDNITEGKDGVYVINGHKFVDLGLPSGLLWATRNVGAESIYEIGNYYSWGEIEPKNKYTLTTYKWFDGDEFTKYNREDGNVSWTQPTMWQPLNGAKNADCLSMQKLSNLLQSVSGSGG